MVFCRWRCGHVHPLLVDLLILNRKEAEKDM
jgi:hypothetical protein